MYGYSGTPRANSRSSVVRGCRRPCFAAALSAPSRGGRAAPRLTSKRCVTALRPRAAAPGRRAISTTTTAIVDATVAYAVAQQDLFFAVGPHLHRACSCSPCHPPNANPSFSE